MSWARVTTSGGLVKLTKSDFSESSEELSCDFEARDEEEGFPRGDF